jgi:hypothetical protein
MLGSAIYPMQWIRLVMIFYGMAVKRMRKMKVPTVKMETVTLIVEGK